MIDLAGKDQSWWPDLSNETVAILASGPSITREQCEVVRSRGWYAIAINETWRLAPWAKMLYGCDWEWWKHREPEPEKYRGVRVVGNMPVASKNQPYLPPEMKHQADRLHHAPVRAGINKLLWYGDLLGAGSNSAFQAVNLAVRCGAKRLVLLGVDCHSPNKHWHENHTFTGAAIQKERVMTTWLRAWQLARDDFNKRGIKCFNCSPKSAVDAFKKVSVENV